MTRAQTRAARETPTPRVEEVLAWLKKSGTQRVPSRQIQARNAR